MNSSDLQVRKGFMLMEVMVAVALSGILLTAILSLQLTVFKRVTFNAQRVSSLISLKQFFSTCLRDSSGSVVNQEDRFSLQYDLKEPQPNSICARFNGMKISTATSSWSVWDGQKQISCSLLSFVPLKTEQSDQQPTGVKK